MAKVSLLPISQIGPEHMASHAGRECYESDAPFLDDGKYIDTKARLFTPGHHTTLQHAPHTYTFQIEDISVSTITFGFHLNHMFYNSDQRSGRFSKMYDNPNLGELESRLKKYFPTENHSKSDEVHRIRNQYFSQEQGFFDRNRSKSAARGTSACFRQIYRTKCKENGAGTAARIHVDDHADRNGSYIEFDFLGRALALRMDTGNARFRKTDERRIIGQAS
jgi:hypothetical protein